MADHDDVINKILVDFGIDSNSFINSISEDSNTTEDTPNADFNLIAQSNDFFTVETKAENLSPQNSNQEGIDAWVHYLQSGSDWQNSSTDFLDGLLMDDSIMTCLSSPPLPTGSSPVEPKAIDNLLGVRHFLRTQEQLLQDVKQSQRANVNQHAVATAAPLDYPLYSSGCQPCTTAVTTNDNLSRQQQLVEIDSPDTKKIRIRTHPRGQFRPRTENESRTSSHYIRCDEGVKPEYPTIDLPYEWSVQTDVNIIEVALVGIDHEPHPYTLENKTSSNFYDPKALIFKQDQRNVLFFRLTDEDFRNGYKSFLMEYIKGKQDDVITKDLIRKRQLDQSMLRFTRIWGNGKDNFNRDETTVQYSAVMQEAYGDIEIEHIGPRYGPLCGNEMVYAILKGRILKNDLTIEINEENSGWKHQIENFTKSGNVIYFLMPPFPYPQCVRMTVYISVNYKGSPIDRFSYLYNGSLDEELAALRISDSAALTKPDDSPKQFNAFDLINGTGVVPSMNPKKRGPKTMRKRLSKA